MSDGGKSEKLLSGVREKVEKLSIYELRQVARAVGVDHPAVGKKERLAGAIMDVASGAVSPVPPSRRGAPPKSSKVDEELVDEINRCRACALGYGDEATSAAVSDAAYERREKDALNLSGVLGRDGEDFVVLTDDLLDKVFVHESFVERYSLKTGNYIGFRCKRGGDGERYGLTDVFTVNGEFASCKAKRGEFEKLTHLYPEKRIYMGGNGSVACRICDIFSPLALGQRAVIAAPSKSGKTRLLKDIALGIRAKYPQIEIVMLLVGEQPEIVTDFKRSLEDIKIFHTVFTQPAEHSANIAALAFEYAKRYVERGKDVIILFDGITRLYHAYRNAGKATIGLEEIKNLLGCAINAEEGGSLTLISTLSDEEADGSVYREFVNSANMIIALSRALAESRTYPAIDILRCGADREEELLTREERAAADAIRAELCGNASVCDIISLFKASDNNEEIISRYKNG